MSELIPTKPYMVRAIHEWCVDNGFTPHLLVVVSSKTRVPMAYVKEGEIVLNLNYSATKDLHIDNEAIVFSARFGGVSQSLYVPMEAVRGIFARENGQGMFFEANAEAESALAHEAGVASSKAPDLPIATSAKKKPTLTIVK
ncbi:MAG: ClpXP protease specificity-enhancing factor [Methylophilaceae bacterium]